MQSVVAGERRHGNFNRNLTGIRGRDLDYANALDPDSYAASQSLAAPLRNAGSSGIVYPRVRHADGQCAGLFFPDLASDAVRGRHLDYHWDGRRVDLYRLPASAEVFTIVADETA